MSPEEKYIANERESAFRNGWQMALDSARGGMPGSYTQEQAWLIYRNRRLAASKIEGTAS